MDRENEKLIKWWEKVWKTEQTTFASILAAASVLRPNYIDDAIKPTFVLRAVII